MAINTAPKYSKLHALKLNVIGFNATESRKVKSFF